MSDPALDLEIRRRIVELTRGYAGLHLREIARQLDTSVALVEYHVPLLESAGLVHVDRGQGFQRLYPSGELHPKPSKLERQALSILRGRAPLKIVLHLLATGPLKHGEIATGLGIGKSTLSFHLGKLSRAGLVSQNDGLFGLVDAEAVQALLLRHKPTPDLRQEFADLWLTFYDR